MQIIAVLMTTQILCMVVTGHGNLPKNAIKGSMIQGRIVKWLVINA